MRHENSSVNIFKNTYILKKFPSLVILKMYYLYFQCRIHIHHQPKVQESCWSTVSQRPSRKKLNFNPVVLTTSALTSLGYTETQNLNTTPSLWFRNKPCGAVRSITPFEGWSCVSYRLRPSVHCCACAPSKIQFEAVLSLWEAP